MKVVRESMKEYNVHLRHEILIIQTFLFMPFFSFFFFCQPELLFISLLLVNTPSSEI